MGRAMTWLTSQRQQMIEILKQIERGSAYTAGEPAYGDLSLLFARLARVAAGVGGKPRTLKAMRQAWWRWTSDGKDASTPPVRQLALIVRHAMHNGWLRELPPDCLPLVEQLQNELQEQRASERRVLERAWTPAARVAVDGLSDFLNSRISRLGEGEGDDWLSAPDGAMAVQEEVRIMISEVVERVVVGLAGPREISATEEGEPLLQPHLGWPDCLRSLAVATSKILTDAAVAYEAVESDAIEEQVREARQRYKRDGGPRRGQIIKSMDDEWSPE